MEIINRYSAVATYVLVVATRQSICYNDMTYDDIGTYERMCGFHVSLGLKHPAYPKTEFSRRQAKLHVDLFADTKSFQVDGKCIYKKGKWSGF